MHAIEIIGEAASRVSDEARAVSASVPWISIISMRNRDVTRCGGRPDLANRRVEWSGAAASKYARFILLHEIGHIVYMRRIGECELAEKDGGNDEERFCDEWAWGALMRESDFECKSG